MDRAEDLVGEIDKLYGHTLTKDFEVALMDAHFGATLRELAGTEAGASLPVVLRAVERSRRAGFYVSKVSAPRVVVADLTGGRGADAFALRLDQNLPFATLTGSFEEVMASPEARDAEVLIVLSKGVIGLDRKVGDYETVTSKYKTGMRWVPNPAYAAARLRAQQAAIAYQSSALNSTIQDSQYCTGWGCLGKFVGQIGAAAAESDARGQLEAATRRLQATPATIDEPIFTPYSFKTVPIQVTKTATIRYDVIDRRSGQHSSGSFQAREAEENIVAYGLKEEDPDRLSYRSVVSSETAVAAFETGELMVKSGDVLAGFTESQVAAKPFKGEKALGKALSAARASSQVATRSQAREVAAPDARFKSAVVIETPTSQGSGFYVERDLVLTNFHVVDDTRFVEIERFDGSETFGKVVASDPRLDLALIRVQAAGTPVTFYKKSAIPLGETVHAIGHPSGLTFTLTRGIVSAVRELESERAPADPPVRYVQTDTPINPGNSGGPLFLGDKVIGVNTGKLAATAIEGIGFAVHHDEARAFVAGNRAAQ